MVLIEKALKQTLILNEITCSLIKHRGDKIGDFFYQGNEKNPSMALY